MLAPMPTPPATISAPVVLESDSVVPYIFPVKLVTLPNIPPAYTLPVPRLSVPLPLTLIPDVSMLPAIIFPTATIFCELVIFPDALTLPTDRLAADVFPSRLKLPDSVRLSAYKFPLAITFPATTLPNAVVSPVENKLAEPTNEAKIVTAFSCPVVTLADVIFPEASMIPVFTFPALTLPVTDRISSVPTDVMFG